MLKSHFHPGIDEKIKFQPRVHPVKQSFIIQSQHLDRIEDKIDYNEKLLEYNNWRVELIRSMLISLITLHVLSIPFIARIISEMSQTLSDAFGVSTSIGLICCYLICVPTTVLLVSMVGNFWLNLYPKPT